MIRKSKIEKSASIPREIIHFYDSLGMISSNHRTIYIVKDGLNKTIQMPFENIDLLGFMRILRRLLRLDKCNIFPLSHDFSSLLVLRQKKVYVLNTHTREFSYKFSLKNCRNVLQNTICRTPSGRIIFGEYGANNTLEPVPVHTSEDNGLTWSEINFFRKGEIKHIHNISYDSYSGNVWIMTGDFEGQCKLLMCSEDLKLIEVFGDGSQIWRTCGMFFEREAIYWLMDSPNEISKVIKMDRKTRDITILSSLAGPVWYVKRLSDGVMVAGVSVEPGLAVDTTSAQLIYSSNYLDWEVALEIPKDMWSMKLFKYGVISFSDGNQSSDDFMISGEGLVGLDGMSMNVKLNRA